MKKELKTKKLLIFLVPLACAGLILISFSKFLLPEVNTIREARQVIKEKEKNLANLTRKAKELESMNETTLRERFEKTNKALPQDKEPILTLSNLRVTAMQNSSSLGKIELAPGLISTSEAKSQPQKGAGDYSSLSFKVKAEGSFSSLKSFLAEIKKVAPVLGIGSLKVDNKVGVYTASIGMEFFWQPLPKTVGKVSDPLPTLTKPEEDVLITIAELKSYPAFSLPGQEATSSPRIRTSPFD